MFSRLIQEYFPDSLKVQLLQDGSLKEPLFKPRDRLPKISREQRLPEAQFNQTNPSIPIEPIQSIIPEKEKIGSINAYFGAQPIVRALDKGADIVITGRCVDSAVTLAACMYNFGWTSEDFDFLSSAGPL